MYALVLTIHIVLALVLIGLVLIQHGKGADIGVAFGSGASNTVFGSQGSGGFLFKLTAVLAAGFFATALLLGYLVNVQYQTEHQAVIVPQSALQVKKDAVPLPDNSVPSNGNIASSPIPVETSNIQGAN